MHVAEEVQEPYPSTDALLEKLQEVLEKADVEVSCDCRAVHLMPCAKCVNWC